MVLALVFSVDIQKTKAIFAVSGVPSVYAAPIDYGFLGVTKIFRNVGNSLPIDTVLTSLKI
jgi:hypothetical protein